MSGVKISFGSSLMEFNTAITQLSNNVQKKIEQAVRQTAQEIIDDTKRHTPVRTGALKAAWRLQKRGSGKFTRYQISNSKKYASFIEDGTRYIRPRRMLANAIARGERRLRSRVAKIIRDENRRAFGGI